MAAPGKNSSILATNVPDWVHEWFRDEALRQKRTVSALAAEVLNTYVKRQQGEQVEEPQSTYRAQAQLDVAKIPKQQLELLKAMLDDLDGGEPARDPHFEPAEVIKRSAAQRAKARRASEPPQAAEG